MNTQTNTPIGRAYDAALAAAKIDASTLELQGRLVSIRINGTRYERRISAEVCLSVESIREAISGCLADHCAIQAALAAALS